MKKSEKILNNIVLVFGIACIAYWLILGFGVRFGQSLMNLWLIAGIVCVLRWAYWRFIGKTGCKPLLTALRIAFCVCLALFIAVEGVIVNAGMAKPEPDLDAIVVLGARVNGTEPSGSLRNRIDRAAKYLEENPNTVAVLSGGQGEGEEISEAQCMLDRMTARGIDEARLTMEDASTDTSENLRYSRALIPEDATVGLVTNDFHIFRACALAKGMGWNVKPVPVATTWISVPHYYLREFIGVVYEFVRGNLG